MPTLAFHVPDPWEFEEQFRKGVENFDTKKAGPFLRQIVESYLSGDTSKDPLSRDILVDLARDMLGRRSAQRMEEAMRGKNQPDVLEGMLRDLLSAPSPNDERTSTEIALEEDEAEQRKAHEKTR